MIFKYENKFLQGKDLLSVIDCGEHHNININEISKRKVEIIFTNSFMTPTSQVITDLICKTSNDLYLYLSKNPLDENSYLKIYYNQDKKNFVDLLIKSFKK